MSNQADPWAWSSDDIKRVGYRVIDLIAEQLPLTSIRSTGPCTVPISCPRSKADQSLTNTPSRRSVRDECLAGSRVDSDLVERSYLSAFAHA